MPKVWRGDASGHVAKSLLTLLDQVNARFPNRSTVDDGTIGNEAHQATKSDHNKDRKGVVRALDLTNDPAHGFVARQLAQQLLDSRDNRLSYVISNNQMARTYPREGTIPWQWSKYTGPSPHTEHCHVSAVGNDVLAEDPRPWSLPMLTGAPPIIVAPPKPPIVAPPPGQWFTNIEATIFGGPTDTQDVAYRDVPLRWASEPGVALPYRFKGPRPKVEVENVANGKRVICDIVDVGPWNAVPGDPYWLTPASRPLVEAQFARKIKAQNGRVPTNKAAIDLTPAAATAIDLKGKGTVNWRFVQ